MNVCRFDALLAVVAPVLWGVVSDWFCCGCCGFGLWLVAIGWFVIVVILGCGFVAVCSACVEFC